MPTESLTRSELIERVRTAVEERDLTQAALADRLGVTQSAIAQALSPKYPGVDELRIRILEELEGEDVEQGFLVDA